jgi:hypothetical protein
LEEEVLLDEGRVEEVVERLWKVRKRVRRAYLKATLAA